jgi:glycosyltransferase domain-containing protein
MDLTIMIATKDRSDFLLRTLEYYSSAAFQGIILVGDSSGKDNYNNNLQHISQYSQSLQIVHYQDIELSADQMIAFLCREVKTTYSVMMNDDDIVLIPSLSHCIDFLENFPEYSAVNGMAFNMGIDHNSCKPFGKITLLKKYPLVNLTSDNAFERINKFFENILNVNMSVVRSEINLDAFNAINQLNKFDSSYVYGELIHASIILARGKIGTIDHCYLVRQKHSEQYYRNISFEDWLKKSDFLTASIELKNVIETELSKDSALNQNVISKKIDALLTLQAKKVVKKMIKLNSYSPLKIIVKRHLQKLINLFNSVVRIFIRNMDIINPSLKIKSSSDIKSLELYFDVIGRRTFKG